jgi:hypothetical protein
MNWQWSVLLLKIKISQIHCKEGRREFFVSLSNDSVFLAYFIGAHFVRQWIGNRSVQIENSLLKFFVWKTGLQRCWLRKYWKIYGYSSFLTDTQFLYDVRKDTGAKLYFCTAGCKSFQRFANAEFYCHTDCQPDKKLVTKPILFNSITWKMQQKIDTPEINAFDLFNVVELGAAPAGFHYFVPLVGAVKKNFNHYL